MAPPEVHPEVEPIAFLLGRWVGEGTGVYPSIASFRYGEETRIWHVGKPFLAYAQRTWSLDDERPLHSESGYWRAAPAGRVELVMAHSNGIVEVAEGTVDGQTIDVASTAVTGTTTAKDVGALTRRLTVDGMTLTYAVRMEAVGHPLTDHLEATLTQVASGPQA